MLKTKISVVPFEGRDKDKHFLITEMPAIKAEKWAVRALLALGRSGIDVPEGMQGAGMAALAIYGIRALSQMHWEDAEPLLNEMMTCVKIMPNPSKSKFARELVMNETEEDDIEEISTLAFLRSEVFELHTGFSLAGALFPDLAAAAEAGSP
jgi:hypothetical protein